jgi:hypothetical protein
VSLPQRDLPDAERTAPRCLDCGAPLAGAYCSDCGQRAQDLDPSFRELVGEAWATFVDVDGRLLSSLRLLLFRPGALTEEYLKGRRTRYLTPLRLYLLCSVAYFLLSSMAPERSPNTSHVRVTTADDSLDLVVPNRDSVASSGRLRRDSIDRALLRARGIDVAAGPLDSASRAMGDSIRVHDQVELLTVAPAWVRRRLTHGIARVMHDNHNFGDDYKAQLPRLMFVLMPVFALLLALAYRGRHRRYPVHLIVSLHIHAFAFSLMTIGAVTDWLPDTPVASILAFVALLWSVAYLPLALRRVYGGALGWAVARTALMATEYAIVTGLALSVLAVGLLLVY